MSESWDDKMSRLSLMTVDEGLTWDLSDNDQAAIRMALGVINAMADDLATCLGGSTSSVIARYCERASNIQEKERKARCDDDTQDKV